MEIKRMNIKSGKIKEKNMIDLNSVISRNDKLIIVDVNGQRGFRTNLVGKDQCFIMNEIGNIIWEIIEEPKKVEHIIEEILKEFNVQRNECESEVMDFLKIVMAHNIIKVNI